MTDETAPEAAVLANCEALIHNLRDFFRAPAKAGSDSVALMQARYVAALGHVALFLEHSGAGEDIARKFTELADAILQLRNGTVAKILRPTSFGSGHGPDGIAIWSYRAEVVKGLECFLKSQMKLREAAKYIADKHPCFNRLKRHPSASLAKSILSWRRCINEGEVPEHEAVQAHLREFFEQHDYPPAQMFALGEQVLAEAADQINKAAL